MKWTSRRKREPPFKGPFWDTSRFKSEEDWNDLADTIIISTNKFKAKYMLPSKKIT